MSKKRKVLIVIPARGGSKRLPKKNLLPLAGKPLIGWTIEAAIESRVAEKIIVSSDNDEILNFSKKYNISTQKRSDYLATDAAKTLDVVLECINEEGNENNFYDDLIILQPTSPLRNSDDLINAYREYVNRRFQTVVSVCELDHPIQWCGSINENSEINGIDFSNKSRSQDLKKHYRLNGAIYIFSIENFMKERSFYTSSVYAYVMPIDRSQDIDNKLDFDFCDFLLSKNKI